MVRDATEITLVPESQSDDSPQETLGRIENHPHRRETLVQRTEDEDKGNPALTRAEFDEMLTNPKNLYKEIIQLIDKSKELRAHNENYLEQLNEARQAIRRNETLLDLVIGQGGSDPGTPTPRLGTGTLRTTKLPDPPLFNGSGKDGTTYDNWLIQLKNKLRGNTDSYPTEELRIIYAAGRLSGNALALVSPRLDAANHHAYVTVKELFEHLDELYGDPNKAKNARHMFKDLVMKKGQTFQEFYAAFLRYVADGNIAPADLKDDLNDKLTWKLQEAVATYYNDPAISLAQFARHCTTNDQQIQSRLEKRDRAIKKPDEIRKGTAGQASLSPTNKSQELEKMTTRKPPAVKAELKCYNCFEPGHISRDCPKPKTERTKQVLAAKLAALTARVEPDFQPGNEEP